LDDSKRFRIFVSVKGKDISSTIKTYKTMRKADYEKEIAVANEALAVATEFQKNNLLKVSMDIRISGGGVYINFYRDAPHAQYHCELRSFDFSFFDNLKELKSNLNKLKRFLKSKCVYEFRHTID
jgi:hypothetical protein